MELEYNFVALITDGSSVMKIFGKNSIPLYVMCYAHSIHLAVRVIFFTKSEEVPGEVLEET